MQRAPSPPHRVSRPRAGSALAEVVVAACVLVVGVLALLGTIGSAAREVRRARDERDATALLSARVERWRTAPCAMGDGSASAGRLRERWTVRRAGTTAVLTDTVTLDSASARRIGVVAEARCAP